MHFSSFNLGLFSGLNSSKLETHYAWRPVLQRVYRENGCLICYLPWGGRSVWSPACLCWWAHSALGSGRRGSVPAPPSGDGNCYSTNNTTLHAMLQCLVGVTTTSVVIAWSQLIQGPQVTLLTKIYELYTYIYIYTHYEIYIYILDVLLYHIIMRHTKYLNYFLYKLH